MTPTPVGDYYLNDSGLVLASRPSGHNHTPMSHDVSNSGVTVGGTSDNGGYIMRDGVVTYIGPQTEAYSINDVGQVTGSTWAGHPLEIHPFVYSNGTLTDIGLLPGATGAYGVAINNRGEVVGGATNGRSNAFLYSEGQLHDLGTLGGPEESFATDINNYGVVVGGSGAIDGRGHAFIYEHGTMLDLNMLVSFDSDLLLEAALAINDSGQIAAYGTFQGQYRAFLLTPTPVPEPSTLAMLTVALTGLIVGRHISRSRRRSIHGPLS
jgi:probable HAF family extracellular repeat protein